MYMTISEYAKNEKRKRWERQLADLQAEINALEDELSYERDSSSRIRIKRKIQEREKEYEDTERNLVELENKNANQSHLDFQSRLIKINFIKALQIFEKIVNQFDSKADGAIFFFQNSHAMEGNYCVSRIRDILKDNTGDFKHLSISPQIGEGLNQFELLGAIGSYFGCILENEHPETQKYAERIIDTICGSIQGGSTIFLELQHFDFSESQEEVLVWFIRHFWKPLKDKVIEVCSAYSKIKFLFFINMDKLIAQELKNSSIFCTDDGFSYDKILELPLTNWSVEEIKDWLVDFMGQADEKAFRKSKIIFDATQSGLPNLVCNYFEKNFNDLFRRDKNA